MNWTDELPTMSQPAQPISRLNRAEQQRQRIGYHVARAGFGTWAADYRQDPGGRRPLSHLPRMEADPNGQADFLDTAAAAIVAIIRAWSPVLPSDWTVTTPPAGASEGGTYPAGILGAKWPPAWTWTSHDLHAARAGRRNGTTPRNRSGRSPTPWPWCRRPWCSWWTTSSAAAGR